jgi:hypothetical protein
MRAGQILPAGLMLLTLLTASGCGSDGLRVEGAETPVSTPGASTEARPTTTPTDSPPPMITDVVDLAKVRRVLLASKNVDPDARNLLTMCTVVARCLRLSPTVDVMHSSQRQVVVTIRTVDGFVFGAFLLALEPAGLRLVWSLKAEQLKIYPSKQGDLVVESKVFGPTDHACCPSGTRLEVYRWSYGRMIRISATQQEGD